MKNKVRIVCERCKREREQHMKTKPLCRSCYVFTTMSPEAKKRNSGAMQRNMGNKKWAGWMRSYWERNPEKYEEHKERMRLNSKKRRENKNI